MTKNDDDDVRDDEYNIAESYRGRLVLVCYFVHPAGINEL